MSFWETITGSDLTREWKVFEARAEALPAGYQAAWEQIKGDLFPYAGLTGRNLMPILDAALGLLEEASADGAAVKISAKVADWKKAHVRPIPGDFQLVGKDGRLVPAEGETTGPVESIFLDLKFTLPAKFEATALKIREFRKTGEHEFPFEFKDVPIR